MRLPNKRNREMFGSAELMLGANHIRIRCFDGVTRTGRIKGKIKKKVWIREGDDHKDRWGDCLGRCHEYCTC